jgi:5-methyltetrahydrofolate--homocysteine methyltransferase
MTPSEATAAFRAQAEGLAEGGVDVLWLETMYAMEELEAAIDAVKDIGLPVCATMSFDTAGKTMMGITPSNLAKRSKDLNLMGFGANCGIGAPDLLATINDISKSVEPDTVVISKANCGIPEFVDGSIVYSGTEELMSEYVKIAMNSGANIIGGCCGTTFDHVTSAPTLEEIEEKVGAMSEGSRSIFKGDDSKPVKLRRSRRSRS